MNRQNIQRRGDPGESQTSSQRGFSDSSRLRSPSHSSYFRADSHNPSQSQESRRNSDRDTGNEEFGDTTFDERQSRQRSIPFHVADNFLGRQRVDLTSGKISNARQSDIAKYSVNLKESFVAYMEKRFEKTVEIDEFANDIPLTFGSKILYLNKECTIIKFLCTSPVTRSNEDIVSILESLADINVMLSDPSDLKYVEDYLVAFTRNLELCGGVFCLFELEHLDVGAMSCRYFSELITKLRVFIKKNSRVAAELTTDQHRLLRVPIDITSWSVTLQNLKSCLNLSPPKSVRVLADNATVTSIVDSPGGDSEYSALGQHQPRNQDLTLPVKKLEGSHADVMKQLLPRPIPVTLSSSQVAELWADFANQRPECDLLTVGVEKGFEHMLMNAVVTDDMIVAAVVDYKLTENDDWGEQFNRATLQHWLYLKDNRNGKEATESLPRLKKAVMRLGNNIGLFKRCKANVFYE